MEDRLPRNEGEEGMDGEEFRRTRRRGVDQQSPQRKSECH